MDQFKTFLFACVFFISFQAIFAMSHSFGNQTVHPTKERYLSFPPLSLNGVIISTNPLSSVVVLRNEQSREIFYLKIGENIFDMKKLPRDTILSELGIHINDIIIEINANELNDASNFFSLINQFRDAPQIDVLIERQGKDFHLLYILR